MGYTPHVLVVGGGSTGTGVARDLAMRGLDVTLVDRGPLAGGTSGSMHALLHSGARYAVDDVATAETCVRENRILRDVADHLVTDAGGLFASLPGDPDDYVETKRTACEAAGIETELLDGADAREREPALSADVERAIAVPDAVIDPARLCVATARSAMRHGAEVRTDSAVVDVSVDRGAIDRVQVRAEAPPGSMATTGGTEWLEPDYVVNAAGPWAADLAGMAGLDVPIRHSQGAMLVTDRAGLETVVNRCRPRTQGDIAVPFGPTSVLGTTDRDVAGPDAVDRDPAAVDRLVDELGDLVPQVAAARPYRAYWGVRALPADDDAASADDVARSQTLLDHEARDDVWGLSTVFGGKLTIHRHIAERVADHVCAKFGIDRACRTADEVLPMGHFDDVGADAAGMPGPNPTLCDCVGVTRRAVRGVVHDEDLPAADDLRPVVQRTGAATGACQGGRCGHRLAAELYPDVDASVATAALDDLHAERWGGLRFACWGDQLGTAARTYRLHVATMGRDGLVGHDEGPDDGLDFAAFDDGPGDGPTATGGETRD